MGKACPYDDRHGYTVTGRAVTCGATRTEPDWSRHQGEGEAGMSANLAARIVRESLGV